MLFGLDAIPLTEARAGVGRYTLELARALAALSPADEFELAYPSSYNPINLAAEDGGLPPNLSEARVTVGALGRRWWSVGLPRYAARRGLDLFHGTNYEVPLWGASARVVTVHDLSLLTRPETHERRRVARARLRLPLMARAADAVVVPTEAVRREACELLRLEASKVFAVHEAAGELFRPLAFEETEVARRRLGVGDEFLLSVGTLEPRKNLHVLLRAFEELVRARPSSQLQLVLAGRTGWLAEPFLAAVADSPARPRVVLTGYLDDETLRALYASCRAFVYPSVYEGFGLPPLEAMSCGAPVVAGRGPALEEVTAGAARLFDPADADHLARILLELLDDEGACRSLSDAARRRARDFSWEKTARLTLDVYAEALKRKGRRFIRF
ncbi:MAG TPA: glycosyltransferase family 1 protein [Pyrinomonadaceae bacterium]|jgi:alpha-1,3-rhamnosyl/mannosyltransferase|nr:glycosyltransferase family 1 protein [Pyrinomonadaceae bacterium]